MWSRILRYVGAREYGGGMDVDESVDTRYEWRELRSLDGRVRWVRGRCLHVHVVPVESGGETVAHLCLVCDEQLPEEWAS